jgi:hypothetical protein
MPGPRESSTISDHCLGLLDHARRRKQPHSVGKPDEVLLIRIESDTLTHIRLQKQLGSGHDEVGVHHFAFRDLTCDPLETILTALRVNGGGEGGTASHQRSNDC